MKAIGLGIIYSWSNGFYLFTKKGNIGYNVIVLELKQLIKARRRKNEKDF